MAEITSRPPPGGEGEKAYLFDLPGVALIGTRNIISQCFRTSEIMVRAWGSNNIALAGDLAGEAGNWAGYLVNLAEEQYTREAAGCLLAPGRRQQRNF